MTWRQQGRGQIQTSTTTCDSSLLTSLAREVTCTEKLSPQLYIEDELPNTGIGIAGTTGVSVVTGDMGWHGNGEKASAWQRAAGVGMATSDRGGWHGNPSGSRHGNVIEFAPPDCSSCTVSPWRLSDVPCRTYLGIINTSPSLPGHQTTWEVMGKQSHLG
ncbi:hypothetical protein Bbelb_114720 [Branchiostoma belcheri]|nr:hypothetical protein Bbelb_114720 [Branchiostoma belcheri]